MPPGNPYILVGKWFLNLACVIVAMYSTDYILSRPLIVAMVWLFLVIWGLSYTKFRIPLISEGEDQKIEKSGYNAFLFNFLWAQLLLSLFLWRFSYENSIFLGSFLNIAMLTLTLAFAFQIYRKRISNPGT